MFMAYSVYVLESQKSGLRYIGFAENATKRLQEHNAGKTPSTKNKGPWEIVYLEHFRTKILAEKRERFFKTGRGKEVLKNLIGA